MNKRAFPRKWSYESCFPRKKKAIKVTYNGIEFDLRIGEDDYYVYHKDREKLEDLLDLIEVDTSIIYESARFKKFAFRLDGIIDKLKLKALI